MEEIRRILVPVDFSDASAAALDAAIDLAKTFGAELHLFHGYPVSPVLWPYDATPPASLERDLHAAAEKTLSGWGERVNASGLGVTTHLGPEPTADAIASKAGEIGADLLVMGTRGLTGLKHAVLGSVAERTVQLAPCPVLTVRAAD